METKLEKRRELRNHILKKLKSKKAGKNFESLLILRTETDKDHYDAWEAYAYYPTFEKEEIENTD